MAAVLILFIVLGRRLRCQVAIMTRKIYLSERQRDVMSTLEYRLDQSEVFPDSKGIALRKNGPIHPKLTFLCLI